MKQTSKYKLGYFEENDITSSVVEMQRWETLDAQLYALYSILGNGILTGWNLLASSGLSVVVTAGSGNVTFVAVKSTDNTTISGLTPNTRNYIYAILDTDSYWNQTVSFVAFLSTAADSYALYLGYVDTDSTSVTDVNTDGRTNLGFINLIKQFIKDHRHIGGSDNPEPIDLGSEVQGTINQRNLPDLDASIITSGTLDVNRLPVIDHITKLINQGTLTHAQLDSFIEALAITNPTLMGETSTIDLLQLILALKHIYPGIDDYLVNEIAYIPGISPDSYVDTENTTAIVDYRTSAEGGLHTITGESAPGKNAYTKTWDSESEFKSDVYSNVFINGDTVTLETEENTLIVDDFVNINDWQVITNDLSSVSGTFTLDGTTFVVPTHSGKLTIGSNLVEMALSLKKEFDAQDWSGYNYIVFYLKTDSVQHGDIYFYLNDGFSGTQNSYTKVLDRNTPTINVDTLQNGWQEITVDISGFDRTSIDTIGFFISTQDGWDTSKGFNFNVDDIYVTTGNKFKENGYVRLIFGSEFLYDFWRVRWDAIIPSDSHALGLELKWRTRVGNSTLDLSQAIWSSYTSISGNSISLPSTSLYKYIEIEVYFGASTDLTRSAYLRKVFLDFYASDVDNSFTYETKDDWDSGDNFNIDTSSVLNSMLISKTDEVNDIFYGTSGNAVQLDDSLNELYRVSGLMLPISTYQALNNLTPSLGLVCGVSRGNDGNIWLADVDNDRVVEVDKSGALIRAFYGSFLSAPVDHYGVEDNGPGSNTEPIIAITVPTTTTTTTTLTGTETTTTTTTTLPLDTYISVLHSIYNSTNGVLYIVFDHDLENVYDSATKLDIHRMYIKIGTQRFNLDNGSVELLGVDSNGYNNWQALSASDSEYSSFVNQFKFTSHVLKVTLNDTERVALNYLVDQKAPSILVLNPKEQERINGDVDIEFLLYNFELGTSGSSNRIRVTVDGVSQDIYSTSVTYSGLSNGKHTLKAQLVNSDNTLNTNIESIANGSFVIYNGTYGLPYITLNTPRINQIYSCSPISIDFSVENFPILPTEQHLKYYIDSEPAIDYYSTDPIIIEDLSAGLHTIRLYLVDKSGNDLLYTYGSVTGTFIVGLNSNAVTKLYMDRGAIYDVDKKLTNDTTRTYIDVGNVYFENIYAPIDVNVIPCETSVINTSGLPNILIAKMRSQSWTSGLSGVDNVNEFIRRLAVEAAATTSETTEGATTTTTTTSPPPPQFANIETSELIYGTNYLDGHSVVQVDLSGNVLFSNNAAIFADTKENVKSLLGSAQKLGDSELLIGDSINKRAIITYTDLTTKIPQIEWQYDSDRFVSDFHIVLQDDVTISVNDDAIDESHVFIRQGTNVIWENNSVSPISIYSGTTSIDVFQTDPDLNLYGDEFKSTVLQPGDRYSFKFVTVGEYNWFVYPSILVGKITTTSNRISSRDQFIILENDGLESPFSSRVIKVNCWGNLLWSFGESYLVKPRDARPLLSGGVIIST